MSKSPKADRATLDRVSKLLPLLNSAHPGEAQAAAAALAKYDLRDVAASLRPEPSRVAGLGAAFGLDIDKWLAEEERKRQLHLERLRKLAQDLLNTNSPLLTKIHRSGLHRIVQLTSEERPAKRDLKYWSQRVKVIRQQITPGAKELESALKVATHHTQHAKNLALDVFDPKHRAEVVNAIGIAQGALAKAAEELRQMEAAS